MDFTPDDLVDLKKALTSSASSMSVNGRTVTFKNADEIAQIIRDIEQSIAAQAPDAKPISKKVTASWSRY